MRLAAKIADRFAKATDELREVADDIRQWRSLARSSGGGHYMGVHATARQESASSLRHALGTAAVDDAGEHATRMLLANTGTKLLFRSTDSPSREYVRDCCPLTPGRPSVADVRPLSTLRPGECYAVLADGRLERRRLTAFVA